MQRRNRLTWRAAGVASTSLVMLLGGAAVSVAPAAAVATAAGSATECFDPSAAHVHADARVRPGAPGLHDPNHLTEAQIKSREADFASALAARAQKAPAGPSI